jgi:antitoxin PrlF
MTKITTKGQVTIPRRLRDHLGLKPGSEVDFELAEDGRVFLKTRNQAPESRFARLRGSAKLGLTTDELMALTRGEDAD